MTGSLEVRTHLTSKDKLQNCVLIESEFLEPVAANADHFKFFTAVTGALGRG